ncbi:flavodoxin family protein [Desertihabitans aurantiacus]|uniref:flavodoxin family protein n=1 Tax=Desertihabitans aurantiacus TaxID=2282477 RepID=UPI000DF81863|nr:flavodoxin family protein [Desertihabitans aurantiacus]
MKVVVLNASPRRDGNSAAMSAQAALGAQRAGHEVDTFFLIDHVQGMLGDCRTCRDGEGRCSIGDGYEQLLTEHVAPADAVIFATPLHYYGMTARLKAFIDRLFCYTANSAPDAERILESLPDKRVGLLISCEETYPGATLGLLAQVQEFTRYNRQELVGVVVGISNSRGEVRHDPTRPLDRAYQLGQRLFEAHVTDYRFDTPRSNKVWLADGVPADPSVR